MPDMCNDAYLKCLTNVGVSFLRLSEMYHIVNGVETWPSYQPPAQLPANICCVIKSSAPCSAPCKHLLCDKKLG